MDIDREAKTITIAELRDEKGELLVPERKIAYDTLVMALGSTSMKGLAVTDTPASVGTTRLRFSSRRKKLSKQGYYGCVISRDGK
ncbi:hypothetical protein MJM83_31865, partial [Salmonella enterica subsp. enterica serovar Montevideo]|nr:hypothetical protein [Salmonella enterica subsp. enterica serovar Montevideo]